MTEQTQYTPDPQLVKAALSRQRSRPGRPWKEHDHSRIAAALRTMGGDIGRTAKHLKIHKNTVSRKVREDFDLQIARQEGIVASETALLHSFYIQRDPTWSPGTQEEEDGT